LFGSILKRIGAAFQAFKRSTADVIPDGFIPISDFSPDDVFIVGYPKSGNTWFQHLVAGVVYGVDPKWAPIAAVQDLVPDASLLKYYRRYAPRMFFKEHSLPRPDYRRVVYLLRDGRDAMVSYRHYREAVDKVKYDFQEFVTPETDLYPCHWPRHVDAWTKNPYGAEILVIKYEDLLAQPVEQLQRFCEFVGISRDIDHLKAVAEAAAFSNLRGKEAKEGWPDPNFEAGKFFFRRGVVGSHKDEMPPGALQIFLGQASETLRRHGYEIGHSAWFAAVLGVAQGYLSDEGRPPLEALIYLFA
jgi:Sulfotransferase domain